MGFRILSKTKLVIFIGMVIIIGLLISLIVNKLVFETKHSEIKTISQKLSNDQSNELKPANYYDETNIYNMMHKMANSKIIAKDGQVWGTLPMKIEDIAALKETILKINYSDRDYLLEVLSRWEKGDFTHCVEEHNYFWNKLGGTIGEAYKLKNNNS